MSEDTSVTRRNFLYITTGTFAAAGSATLVWPFVDQMNPDASVKALASTEVDLTPILPGQSITILWRGKPVFIRRRTQEEIVQANNVDIALLRDPMSDKDRVQKDEWLVLEGVCTHLGCVPLGQKMTDTKGEYNGWFCPCHGSHYDTSGRIRKGPAPKNLEIPEYVFLDDNTVKIG